MIIIETCPKCGHDLTDLIIATNPPIPKKECFNCGWSWTGEREEVVRIPFGGNSYTEDEAIPKLNDYRNFGNSACERCSNNPKNGGSGNCSCILGQQGFYY